MKKGLLVVCLLLFMTVAQAKAQGAPNLGAGVYGGLNFPLLQDDQERGTEFGFKVRYGLGSIITLEPYAGFVKWGDPDPVDPIGGGSAIDLGITGSKVTSFGLEASLGNLPGMMGVSPYFVAGLGSYKVKNDDTGYEESAFGWSGGLGLGIGVSPKFALDVRGKVMVAPQDAGSKKAVGVTVGVNFHFGGE